MTLVWTAISIIVDHEDFRVDEREAMWRCIIVLGGKMKMSVGKSPVTGLGKLNGHRVLMGMYSFPCRPWEHLAAISRIVAHNNF